MSSGKHKEFHVIIVNPKRCTDCEICMSICSFIHDKAYKPLKNRVIGARKRIEIEWAISCDLCKGVKEDFVDPTCTIVPQCILSCPHNAIFQGTIEGLENESRIEAIKRIFSLKLKKQINDRKK